MNTSNTTIKLSVMTAALMACFAAQAQQMDDNAVKRVYGTSGAGPKNTELWGRIDLGLRNAPTSLNPTVAASATTGTATTAAINTAQDGGAKTTTSLTDASQGRFGFRGTTGPLSGGVQGIFNLEARFNADDGTTRTDTGSAGQFFRDKSFAGLVTPYGAITIGRQSGIADNMTSGRYEAFGGDSYASNGTRAAGALAKLDNSIYYLSPTYMGLTGNAHFALAERKAVTVPVAMMAKNGSGFGIDYANGPASLSFGMQRDSLIGASSANNTTAANSLAVDNRRTIVFGGSYDFQVFKLVSTYANTKGMNLDDTGSSNVTTFGVKVPAGPGEFRISYAKRRDDRAAVIGGNAKAGVPGTAPNAINYNSDVESNRLGIGYNLPMGASNSLNFSLVKETQRRFLTKLGTYERVGSTNMSGQGIEISYRLIF